MQKTTLRLGNERRLQALPRRSCTVKSGKSMPETSSGTLRNGVDEGQAPAQMPQAAQRSASTTALFREEDCRL